MRAIHNLRNPSSAFFDLDKHTPRLDERHLRLFGRGAFCPLHSPWPFSTLFSSLSCLGSTFYSGHNGYSYEWLIAIPLYKPGSSGSRLFPGLPASPTNGRLEHVRPRGKATHRGSTSSSCGCRPDPLFSAFGGPVFSGPISRQDVPGKSFFALNFPVPVFLKRFAAPRLVFNFGTSFSFSL